MDFLLDSNMPRSALRALTGAGHQAWHVRDIGLGDAPDERIDRHALTQGWVLVTRDLDFCDIRNYPPEHSPGRLVLRVDDTSTADEIPQLLKRFFIKILNTWCGKLKFVLLPNLSKRESDSHTEARRGLQPRR